MMQYLQKSKPCHQYTVTPLTTQNTTLLFIISLNNSHKYFWGYKNRKFSYY